MSAGISELAFEEKLWADIFVGMKMVKKAFASWATQS
jgi:phosphopantothenoylcysteine synthetase/decarboxylase